MLVYTKLWILLNKKGMKRTDLKNVISSATLAKLGKNEPVSSTVIEKICDYLKCQPGDIMENVTKEDLDKASDMMNDKMNEMFKLIEITTGMSKETMLNQAIKELPSFIEMLKNDKIDFARNLENESNKNKE